LQAFLRQADAFSAMGEIQAALSALKTALHFDPSLRRSKSYQVDTGLWTNDTPPAVVCKTGHHIVVVLKLN
jgi:hypothetical protein